MIHTEQVSVLFRDIESDLGTQGLNRLVLTALIASINEFKVATWKTFMSQFHELLNMIESTEPKFAITMDNFYELWELLKEEESRHDINEEPILCKKLLIHHIASISEKNILETEILIDNGISCIEDNDVLLIHNHSSTVLNILKRAFDTGKKFSVVVAEQDLEKTHAVIEFLNRYKISFRVIPSYMLSHIEDIVTKVFLGAVTLKSTFDFVMDAGSNAVISEFYLQKKPCYMFISTSKFSLWHSEKKQHDVYHVKDTRQHKSKKINFERLKFSHDRVPLEYFDKIITEKGVVTPMQLRTIYQKLYKQRKEHEVEREQRFSAQDLKRVLEQVQ